MQCDETFLEGSMTCMLNLVSIYIYIRTAMLGTREYTLCSPFRANAHNSSLSVVSILFRFSSESHVTFETLFSSYSHPHCSHIELISSQNPRTRKKLEHKWNPLIQYPLGVYKHQKKLTVVKNREDTFWGYFPRWPPSAILENELWIYWPYKYV